MLKENIVQKHIFLRKESALTSFLLILRENMKVFFKNLPKTNPSQ